MQGCINIAPSPTEDGIFAPGVQASRDGLPATGRALLFLQTVSTSEHQHEEPMIVVDEQKGMVRRRSQDLRALSIYHWRCGPRRVLLSTLTPGWPFMLT